MKKWKWGIIYKYTSPSGKCYIGQTINEKDRKRKHKLTTAKSGTKFGNAISKYGFESLEYEILFKSDLTDDIESLQIQLNTLEIMYIEQYDSYYSGYNLTKGGDGVKGFKHTDETKEKISKASSNMSQETKDKISKAGKGRIVSAETREKISKSSIGKKMSDSARQKMSDFNKGKTYTEDQIQKFKDCSANKKTVYQYDKSWNFINSFPSGREAARVLNIDGSAISKVCRGVLKTTGGFIFTYEPYLDLNYKKQQDTENNIFNL